MAISGLTYKVCIVILFAVPGFRYKNINLFPYQSLLLSTIILNDKQDQYWSIHQLSGPHTNCHIIALEKIQHRAARFVCNNYSRYDSITESLDMLTMLN